MLIALNICEIDKGAVMRIAHPVVVLNIVTLATAVEGDRVVIDEHTTYPDGRKLVGTQTWELDATGELVIEIRQQMAGKPAMNETLRGSGGIDPSISAEPPPVTDPRLVDRPEMI
jgi:hypothetical protein